MFDPRDLEEPHRTKARGRVLTDQELAALLGALGYSRHDAVLRLILLTACRLNEAAQATWGEFDLDNATWSIPAKRRKTDFDLTIPLSCDAVELLRCQVRAEGGAVWGAGWGVHHNWDRYQKKLFKRSKTGGWHRHDLRRTAATILGRLGHAPHVIEAVLGHADVHTRLASVYNKARYTDDHRQALADLAEYYKTITKDDTLIT